MRRGEGESGRGEARGGGRGGEGRGEDYVVHTPHMWWKVPHIKHFCIYRAIQKNQALAGWHSICT